MTLKQLNERIVQFVQERDWEKFHDPKNLSMALNIETAELMELFLWTSSEKSDERVSQIKNRIEEEVGDILIYLLMLANRADINILDAAEEKLEKNKKKYPVSTAKGSSKKYNEL